MKGWTCTYFMGSPIHYTLSYWKSTFTQVINMFLHIMFNQSGQIKDKTKFISVLILNRAGCSKWCKLYKTYSGPTETFYLTCWDITAYCLRFHKLFFKLYSKRFINLCRFAIYKQIVRISTIDKKNTLSIFSILKLQMMMSDSIIYLIWKRV